MQNKCLVEMLKSMREARYDLVFRTTNEEPQLFSSFFEYENDQNLLTLSFEREHSIFINNNLERFLQNLSDINDVGTKEKLKEITEKLVQFKQNQSSTNLSVFFLEDRVNQIDKIFSIFEKDKDRQAEINYLKRKDNVLFEREFNKLLREQNGLGK